MEPPPLTAVRGGGPQGGGGGKKGGGGGKKGGGGGPQGGGGGKKGGGGGNKAPKWSLLAPVRRLDDTDGRWSQVQLRMTGEQLGLWRKAGAQAFRPADFFRFDEITHLVFGPVVMARIFRDYPERARECEPWCCMSFRTSADITYDIVAEDGRAARALYHTLQSKNPHLVQAGERSQRGYLLWSTTRMRLQQQAQDGADDMASLCLVAMKRSCFERVRWEVRANDWRKLRLLDMTASERDRVFARGAYDPETCAPYLPRGVLHMKQAKKCVCSKLPGGGLDGTAPDGGKTLALQPPPPPPPARAHPHEQEEEEEEEEDDEQQERPPPPPLPPPPPPPPPPHPHPHPVARDRTPRAVDLPNRIDGMGTAYKVLAEGSGMAVSKADNVTVHATGKVKETGEQFWSTKDPGQQPFTYQAGVNKVIRGWDQGCLGMKVGSVRELDIPADEGYGADGVFARGIPPNADLVFEIEVLEIHKIAIKDIKNTCWVWAFEAARPEDEKTIGEFSKSEPGLGEKQFRSYLEYLSYFHQNWERFSGLEKIVGEKLHKNRPLGDASRPPEEQYELQHAAQMLLGGVDNPVAETVTQHLEDRTLFGLVVHIAEKELDLMKKRDELARERLARERGKKAREEQEEQARKKADARKEAVDDLYTGPERGHKARAARGQQVQVEKKFRSRKEALEHLYRLQKELLDPAAAARRSRHPPQTAAAAGEAQSPGGKKRAAPGGGTWFRVKQAAVTHESAEAAAEAFFGHHDEMVEGIPEKPSQAERKASKAEKKLEKLRASTTAALQVGEVIQALDTRPETSDATVQYVRFARGWTVCPADGSVMVPCNPPSASVATKASSPVAKAAAVGSASAWKPSVSGSTEQQAKTLHARHVHGWVDEEWSHGWVSHRTKAPSVTMASPLDKRLAELEKWKDEDVRQWLRRKGLAKLAKPLAEEGFNGRGLAALYRTTHATEMVATDGDSKTRTTMAAEYLMLFRNRVAQRVSDSSSSSGGGGGGGAGLSLGPAVPEGTWRTFDAALQELCGEGVVQRLSRDTAQRVQNAKSKMLKEAAAAKAKSQKPSMATGGQTKKAGFHRQQVQNWLQSELGPGYDINYYHATVDYFHGAGHEAVAWRRELETLKENGKLHDFLQEALDRYFREAAEGDQTLRNHTRLKRDCSGFTLPHVATLGEKAATAAQKEREKKEKEREAAQKRWEPKAKEARIRLRQKKKRNKMQPETEYGYPTGFERSRKSDITEEADLTQDADPDSIGAADPNAASTRGRSGGKDGGSRTQRWSPQQPNPYESWTSSLITKATASTVSIDMGDDRFPETLSPVLAEREVGSVSTDSAERALLEPTAAASSGDADSVGFDAPPPPTNVATADADGVEIGAPPPLTSVATADPDEWPLVEANRAAGDSGTDGGGSVSHPTVTGLEDRSNARSEHVEIVESASVDRSTSRTSSKSDGVLELEARATEFLENSQRLQPSDSDFDA